MTAEQVNEENLRTQHGRLMTRAAWASIIAGTALTAVKLVAWILTGSVALLTSLVDSLIDVCASLINMVAVRQSLVPADEEHRFGHGKVESLAGLAQAAFICGSVLFILFEAVNKLINPVPVEHGMIGIGVMIISIFVTIGLLMYQRYVISVTSSVAINADSLHYASDLWLNVSVIIAIILSYRFGFTLADPLIALGIGVYIIYSAWQIAKTCLDQLMDRELPDDDREKIRQIAAIHPQVRDIHELRTRASGRDIFIQLHLVMDHQLALEASHRIAVEVEKNIRAAFPHADVIIHQDPDTEKN